MKIKRKYVISVIIIIGLLLSSIPIILYIISQNPDQESISLEFTPNEMKSYPNHTAWFLLEVRTKNNDIMDNLSLSIITNRTIKMDYQIWDNTPLRKIIEIFLYPNNTHLDSYIQLEVNASSTNLSRLEYALVQVIDWTPNLSPLIESMKDVFVNYLNVSYPNFKINETIIWDGFGNSPQILIVEHYLFKSTFWEMELARHVTIAPHDWVKIYLRPRYNLIPNWSGIIESWSSGNHTVNEIEPPNEIFR